MLIKPYGDTFNDGAIQISFSLPLPLGEKSKKASLELALKMGIANPKITFTQDLGEDFSFFIIYGNLSHEIDIDSLKIPEVKEPIIDFWDINRLIDEKFKRKIVIVGATIGSDAHTVGLDAILSAKGYAGDVGLERYPVFQVHNLGSQVLPELLLEQIMDLQADVVLVSQVVTQKNIHIHNLTQLVELIEGAGLRDHIILICGGPYLSKELALELGYDGGFGAHSLPSEVASFIARRLLEKSK
ncbi:MAG: D-lysine 5,6-aminomutase beta subunit [candidate division WS2 bacterium]|nr:D-lysine 5,6-aminomutase beta subunit [Candidatus Lithacetigena glycinireducens]